MKFLMELLTEFWIEILDRTFNRIFNRLMDSVLVEFDIDVFTPVDNHCNVN